MIDQGTERRRVWESRRLERGTCTHGIWTNINRETQAGMEKSHTCWRMERGHENSVDFYNSEALFLKHCGARQKIVKD